jgi:hypothetical protein
MWCAQKKKYKLFKNVTTNLISMSYFLWNASWNNIDLGLQRCIYVDAPQNIIVGDNLNLLCDLELILGLLVILSFLDCVHALTKFPQSWDILMWFYWHIMKIC